jgi:DNA polymerase III subunit delta
MTKLRLDQLPQHLQGKLHPVYLVSGDETLLVQEACDAIRKAVYTAGFSERERHHISDQHEWSQLLIVGKSLSLFSHKKLIEFHTDNDKLGDSGSKAIAAYLVAPSSDNILLIVTPKLNASQQQSKWLKTIIQQGIWIPIWSLDNAQFRRWVSQRLQQSGLSVDTSAINILVDRTEGNLLAAAQEIEKLTLLATDGVVSSSLMDSVIIDSARFNVFNLTDKALSSDAQGAARCLQGLKNEGVETTIILWGLTREVRNLLMIKQKMEDGQAFASAIGNAGIWDKRKPLIQQALSRLSRLQLEWLLRRANAIDKAIKGLRSSDVWSELLDLTLTLAGVPILSLKNQRLSLQA